jgi:AAA family ATP:ADP antiporter
VEGSPTARRGRPQLVVAISGAIAFGALLTSYTALKPVRDALILDGDPDQIPWVWVGTFVVISVVSPLWSALLANRARRDLVPRAFHAFAASELVFLVLAKTGASPVAVGRAFYIWSAVFSLFVVSVFWSLLADMLGTANARRLYGPIAAGGTVGSFFGPLLTRLLVGPIGIAGMLVVSALLIELAVIGVAVVRRAAAGLPRDATNDEPDVPAGGGAFTGIAHIVKSPYLLALVGYVLCTSFAATFMYLRQQQIVHDALADRVARTSYFSTLALWQSGITFVLQTVVAGPAIGALGPAVVLCVLPLAQAAGISMLAAAPSLSVLMVMQVISQSATHGLTRPARELLFTVLSRDDRYRAKHAIDTIVYRFGDLASGWLFKALIAIGGIAALVGTSIPLVGLWIALAAALGVGFRRRVPKETP